MWIFDSWFPLHLFPTVLLCAERNNLKKTTCKGQYIPILIHFWLQHICYGITNFAFSAVIKKSWVEFYVDHSVSGAIHMWTLPGRSNAIINRTSGINLALVGMAGHWHGQQAPGGSHQWTLGTTRHKQAVVLLGTWKQRVLGTSGHQIGFLVGPYIKEVTPPPNFMLAVLTKCSR